MKKNQKQGNSLENRFQHLGLKKCVFYFDVDYSQNPGIVISRYSPCADTPPAAIMIS